MTTRQPGQGDLPAPSVRSLVALLVLVTLAAAVGVVLFLATPYQQRPDVWAALRMAWPPIVVFVPVALSYLGIRRVGAETARQSVTLSTIHRNTNGVLDERIRNGVRAVLNETAVPADSPAVAKSRMNASSDETRTNQQSDRGGD